MTIGAANPLVQTRAVGGGGVEFNDAATGTVSLVMPVDRCFNSRFCCRTAGKWPLELLIKPDHPISQIIVRSGWIVRRQFNRRI